MPTPIPSSAFLKAFRPTRRLFLFTALLSLTVTGARAAQLTPQQTFDAIIATVVRPGFDRLADAAARHAEDWRKLCEENSAAQTIASFHELADAWAAVEMFRMGPASKDFVRDKLYLWPERKNAVARAMAAALKTPDSVKMDDAWMRQQSAAIQGLPALERLLFGEGEGPESLKPNSPSCRLGVAAAANVESLTASLARDWKNTVAASPENRTALATDIVTGIGLANEEKLEAVIGKNEAQAKPKAAEFWRSHRSLRNLAINLETYSAIAAIAARALADPATMTYTAETAAHAVANLREPLSEYAKGEKRKDAYLLRAALDALGDSASADVSAALDVTVGFNSADGD